MEPMLDDEWLLLCAIACGMCVVAVLVVLGFF
jgi:hypothetical protein